MRRFRPVRALTPRWAHAAPVMALMAAGSAVGTARAATAGAQHVAHTTPSRIAIPANFVYVSSVKNDRCLWGIGVEFPTVPKANSYTIDYYDGYYGHEVETGTTVPVPNSPDLGHGMNYLGITGGGGPAPCVADVSQGGRFVKPAKAWANFPGKAPDTGAIEGLVTDSDGNPVQGAVVTSYGPTHATAVSGPGGIYYMTVDRGNYRVVPDDSSAKKSGFTPAAADVSVASHGSATANFKLHAGLQVTLDLTRTSVPASGFAIVEGTLSTTRLGRPAPGVTVQLAIDPTDEAAALTTAPKVAVCGTGGRIWPSGNNITSLDSKPVNVVTDANGHYKFSLTVGTVPGSWTLDAWAENTDGSLSTDVTNASDTKVLTVTAVTPTTAVSDFLTELGSLKGSSYGSQLNPQNAGAFALMLGTLAASSAVNGFHFSGLEFSVANAADGQSVVIAPATTQFRIAANGTLERSSALLNSLVVDPQEWTGKGLPAAVTSAASLNYVVQNGLLKDIPTVASWEAGSAGHPGWSLKPQTPSISTNALAWWGWAYPPPAAWPTGYCQ